MEEEENEYSELDVEGQMVTWISILSWKEDIDRVETWSVDKTTWFEDVVIERTVTFSTSSDRQ